MGPFKPYVIKAYTHLANSDKIEHLGYLFCVFCFEHSIFRWVALAILVGVICFVICEKEDKP